MDTKKIKKEELIIAILIPVATGVVSGLISGNSMQMFDMVKKPPLSPPGWLFPVVWTILYIFMGIASYLIYREGTVKPEVSQALLIYGIQLVFNFFWSIIFFNFEWYWFAFVWLMVLWILILVMIIRFAKISRPAAYLMIPYLVWCTFAAYLNLGIAVLN